VPPLHESKTLASFGCTDKLAEKHCWLICCERKILFRMKKQTEKTEYKPDEQGLNLFCSVLPVRF
jgi:hypothetical protein